MAMEAGTAYVTILPSVKNFGKDLGRDVSRSADEAGEGWAKGFGKKVVATIGAIGVGAAVGKFFTSSIAAASDLDETVNKINVVFGDSAEQMRDWASTAATTMGLSTQKALDAAAGFGTMFTQLGFTTDSAKDMSQGMVVLASDLASFHNLQGGAAEATDMLSAAFRGEYDSLQRVIPTINAAAVEQKALEQTGKDSAKELTAAEKAAAVYALTLEGAGPAVGDFAATSDGLANTQRSLSAMWDDLKAKVGEAFLGAATTAANFVKDNFIPALEWLQDAVQAVADKIREWQTPITIIASVIGVLLIPMFFALGVQALVAAARTVAAWAIKTAAAVAGAASQIFWLSVTGIWYVKLGVQAMLGAARTAAAWLLQKAQAAAGAAYVVGQLLWLGVQWIAQGVKAMAGAARTVAAWALQRVAAAGALAQYIIVFAVMAAQWVAAGVRALVGAAVVAGGWLLMAGAAIVNAAIIAVQWLIAFWPVALVIAIVVGLIAIIWVFWDEIKAALTTVKNFLQSVWNSVWNWVKNLFSSMWNWISGVWNGIYDSISSAVTAVKDWAVNTWTSLKDRVVGIFQSVKDRASEIWDSLVGVVRRAVDTVKGIGEGIWNGLKGVINAGIRLLNAAIGGFNAVIGAVNLVPGVNIPNIPNIPQLADGGIVTRATLAVVGEAGPEAVVPLDRWERGGGQQVPNVRVYIGDRELKDLVRVEVDRSSASLSGLLAGRRLA